MLTRANSLFLPHLVPLSKEEGVIHIDESSNVWEEEIVKSNCNGEFIQNKTKKMPLVGPLIS